MRTFPCVVLATVLTAASLGAQDVTVHSTSTVRFHGAFGKVMSLAARLGGKNLSEPTPSTMYVAGHKMRTDDGDNAAVVDLDAGRLISIDNKAKSYTTFTFEEMADMTRRMGDSLRVARERPAERTQPSDAKGEVEMKYQVSVDRPGERAKIAGYDAERIFMTITMTAEVTPEGEKKEEAGSMVFLVDEWVSKNAGHAAAMREFQRAYAQKLGQEFQNAAKSLDAAFSTNPQLKEGFEAAARERQKVEGISVRSTTFAVFLPAGMTFDRKLALSEESAAPVAQAEEKKGGGLRGMIGGLRKMADDANKKGDAPASAPKQATMMTVKTEVGRINTGRVDPSLFVPPAGYKEVKMRGT